MTKGLCLFVLVAAIAVPRGAIAGPGPMDDAEPATETWYGSHTLIVDGVSLGLLLASGFPVRVGDPARSDELFALGYLGTLFGAPIVHATRGNWANAGESLLLRVAIPSATTTIYMLGAASCDSCEGDRPGPAIVIGLAVAAAIDAAFIATEPVEESSPTWAPNIALTGDGGGTIGFTGSW